MDTIDLAPNPSDMMIVDETMESSSTALLSSKKTTSKIWRFFDRVKVNGKERAKCKKCGSSYAPGGTSNMWRHTEKYCVERDSVDREVEFDQDIFREKLTKAMVMHNQPFKFVEYKGFRDAFTYANPKIKHISKNTAKADILKIYHVEKEKLKKVLESINGRICLTSDLWTSCASNGYMTVTAHYVDNDWVLRCKVLIFRNIPPRHDGPTVGENLISFLQKWGIERKVFTLTLDNAKYNDDVVDLLKNHLLMTNSLFFNGEFLHIRCGAHVLNLIVQMGLGTIAEAVEKIRESVKYVRGSEMRTFKFCECVKHLKLSVHKKLKQDLPYRWNSTYLMLDSALLYRRAFMHLSLFDSNYKTCPSMEEWIRVEKIAMFLAPFFDMTELFSGTQYPTASLYFPSVLEIQLLIQAEMESTDLVIQAMAKEMKPKFDKYWQEYSTVLLFAVVLDPRYKLRFVKFAFNKIDARTTVSKLRELKNHMQEFLEEYLEETPSSSSHASYSNEGHRRTGGRIVNEFEASLSQEDVATSRSQLELYLAEPLIDTQTNLNVFEYWRANVSKYPELSLMARDVLSIPITTVASESTFSRGGRILGKYRSTLLPKNAEALVCGHDWLEVSDDEDEEVAANLTLDVEKLVVQVGSTTLDSQP